jgi:Spy/CpxP family protein refolding chaperone
MKRIFTLSIAALLFAGSAIAQDTKTSKDKAGKEWKKDGQKSKPSKHGKHKGAEFAKALNLTDAQKEQFKALKTEYKGKNRELKAEQKSKAEAILTTEQKAKLAQLKEKRKKEAKNRGANRFADMQKELGITKDQAAQLKAQNESFRNKAKAIRENESLSKEQKKEQTKALLAERKESMKGILTAEQIQKMEAKRKDGKGKRDKKDRK